MVDTDGVAVDTVEVVMDTDGVLDDVTGDVVVDAEGPPAPQRTF